MTIDFNTPGKIVHWPLEEWQNADAGMKQSTNGRNADAGPTFPAFRHLLMILQE